MKSIMYQLITIIFDHYLIKHILVRGSIYWSGMTWIPVQWKGNATLFKSFNSKQQYCNYAIHISITMTLLVALLPLQKE